MGFNYGGRGAKKNKGPNHGHGNKGKGGGGAYGNNIGLTISQAKQIYANQLAEGSSLQQAMASNPAETVNFYDLIDNTNTPTTNSTNNNTMALTASQQKVQDKYQEIFGRDASFGTLGGADYWTDQIDNNSLSDAELTRILTESSEGQSVTTAADGTKSSWIGGVNPNLSIAQNQANDANAANPWDKSWASHFTPGGTFGPDSNLTGTIWEGMAGAGDGTTGTTQNVAGLLNATYNANNPDSTFPNPFYNNAPLVDDGTGHNNIPIVGGGNNTTPDPTAGGWWNQFADADAFKTFLQGDQTQNSGGMDDFMKFMMLMSVMGGKGGGGGYGGSQYGYGGLNPGGVMQAYDPMAQLQGMGTWFKDNFGSGGATTSTVNTGTAGN